MTGSVADLVAIAIVVAVTLGIGAVGLRLSRTTSDFFVASRSVSPRWNASAIGGEYLSGASFLGVAGLVLAVGADMLWFPVGYTAGYLVLIALVAAPLRRSGAYTLPDFAQARLESRVVRGAASVLVVAIGWLYLLPQLKGAGIALEAVSGLPEWAGAAGVAVVVVLGVVAGGMRSITFVQAFQYWLKLTAICLPVAFLVAAWQADGRPTPGAPGPPTTRDAVVVEVADDVRLVSGTPATIEVDGREVVVGPDGLDVSAGSAVRLEAGAVVPQAQRPRASDGHAWVTPLQAGPGRDHPLYATYSLVLALLFGTMGLPHVLVRFYTNPDGRAARRTTLVVVALLGLFYLWPTVYGVLGRIYAPDLLLTGRTDTVVLELPSRLVPGLAGELLSSLLAAGAFAAFLSTSSGLAVSVTGVISQDVLPLLTRARRPVRDFRVAAGFALVVPLALSLLALDVGIADTVGLAFAVAASTFCPLLVLGIWWRGLSTAGALAGLGVGGLTASAAVVVTLVAGPPGGWPGALLAQPAAWTVPLAFVAAVVVSRLTPGSVPAGVGRTMVRLHAPEALDVDRAPQGRRDPA